MAAALSVVRDYADLTKPRLLPLVLLTGLPVLGMSADGWPSAAWSSPGILLGIALAAAAANTLNAYLEHEKDALMERTRGRPVPAGLIAPRAALVFGLVAERSGDGPALHRGRRRGAGLGVASILFYVFVYTLWLKPRSAWNTVIGGAAGAVAPLIADAAVDGRVGPAGLALFAIIFFWQPPHVWAIALYRKPDYAAAGIAMLPNVIGDQPTRWRMLWYTLGAGSRDAGSGRPRVHGRALPGGGARRERLVHLGGRAGAEAAHGRGRAAHVPGLSRLSLLAVPGDARRAAARLTADHLRREPDAGHRGPLPRGVRFTETIRIVIVSQAGCLPGGMA